MARHAKPRPSHHTIPGVAQSAGPGFPARAVRASDAERERCAQALRVAYAEGRLSLEELRTA